MRFANLPEPQREFRFCPTRKWRFDFAWPLERQIALEVDGGQWIQGRHARGRGMRGDCEKFNTAALAGWTVYRVTGDMVQDGSALALMLAVLGGTHNPEG